MVLERILSGVKGKKRPLMTFLLGAFISAISLFIAYTVFKESTGLFTVVIISLIMTPFMNQMISHEEAETEKVGESQTFFQRYGDIITAFTALFCGMILSMSLVFVILPCDDPNNLDTCPVGKIFDEQIEEINIIRGRFTFGSQFLSILTNNISVLTLSFLFSFLLGAGAIFILSWNASVLSAAIGLIAKSFGGVRGIPVAVFTFLPHGSFEIMAYFIGAIAGGLVSATVTKKRSFKFWFIIKDCGKLFLISLVFLVVGAVIETAIILV